MAETPFRATVVTLGTAATAIYTGSTTTTNWTVIRNIHITNETAAQITVTVGISPTPATDAATGRRWYSSIPLAANSALDWSGFLVIQGAATAEVLYGLASAASAATVTVSGITGP